MLSNIENSLKLLNKAVYNIKKELSGDSIVLNVDFRTNTHDSNSHSIWKLVRDGDKEYRPGTEIETGWWDSLIGSNSVGNKVPDMDLAINERYGNKIRPRQSWYVNRFDALKEIIDYANTVLKKHELANIIKYDNLNSFDAEPTVESLEWDVSVNTYADSGCGFS